MRIFGGKGVFSSGREREKDVRISKASERKDFFFLGPSSLPSETSKPLRYILSRFRNFWERVLRAVNHITSAPFNG